MEREGEGEDLNLRKRDPTTNVEQRSIGTRGIFRLSLGLFSRIVGHPQ